MNVKPIARVFLCIKGKNIYGEVGETLTFNPTTRMKGSVERLACQRDAGKKSPNSTDCKISPSDCREMSHIITVHFDLRTQVAPWIIQAPFIMWKFC